MSAGAWGVGRWLLRAQVPIHARSGDAEGLRDLGGAFSVGAPGLGCGELVRVHDGGSSADAALFAGCRQTGQCAFLQHVSFQFGGQQPGAFLDAGGDLVLEDAVASGGVQCISLQLDRVRGGGDAAVADEFAVFRGGHAGTVA